MDLREPVLSVASDMNQCSSWDRSGRVAGTGRSPGCRCARCRRDTPACPPKSKRQVHPPGRGSPGQFVMNGLTPASVRFRCRNRPSSISAASRDLHLGHPKAITGHLYLYCAGCSISIVSGSLNWAPRFRSNRPLDGVLSERSYDRRNANQLRGSHVPD